MSTVILGWVWNNGSLSASTHRIATLSTCSRPVTVKDMRSFLGVYRFLLRILPKCAQTLAPLEEAVSGHESQEKIDWSAELEHAFNLAQGHLQKSSSITLPQAADQLWIVTDASVKAVGLAATLYVMRHSKLHLSGHFSARLRSHQRTWLPCELEALAIAASVKHFSPYIIQSHKPVCVLTDSKPCMEAAEKLCRGEFSASPRVATFLSTVSRFQVSIRHLAGTSNAPSDFGSRNAPSCTEEHCQICVFIRNQQDATVLHVAVQDVFSGAIRLPFSNRTTWLSLQSECPDMRRTHAHLKQGTKPSRKLTNLGNVKRYLRIATIAFDWLLVVRQRNPLSPTRERIIIPCDLCDGLFTALHLWLGHPTKHQLKLVSERFFYALDMEAYLQTVTDQCHQCADLRNVPAEVPTHTTSDPPPALGVSFSLDVLRQAGQCILVLRENVSAYTKTCLVPNEQGPTLRDAIICLTKEFVPLEGPPVVVRIDGSSGLTSLTTDELLRLHRIFLEIGHIKNKNKNPVAEKAVQELEHELIRLDPSGGTITGLTLCIATAHLNKRIRGCGVSAWEIWTQRDMFTNEQIPLNDLTIIDEQYTSRSRNHRLSECSKTPRRKPPLCSSLVSKGDLVYLTAERDRYIVPCVDGPWCDLKKFCGSQLRNKAYRVRRNECFKVVPEITTPASSPSIDLVDEDVLDPTVRVVPGSSSPSNQLQYPPPPLPSQPSLPPIPPAIHLPDRSSIDTGQSNGGNTTSVHELETPEPEPPPSNITTDPGGVRRSNRDRRPNIRLKDYVLD